MAADCTNLKIADIMRAPHTIVAGKNFHDALTKMITERTNSLLVIDTEGKLVGIVNAHSLIKAVVPDYLEGDQAAAQFASEDMFREEVMKATGTGIEECMITDVPTVDKNDSLMKAAVLATAQDAVRIPVVDDEHKPIGLLTRTEIKQVIGVYLGIPGCFEG